MTQKNRTDEIVLMLQKISLDERQKIVAQCADNPTSLGAAFFGAVLLNEKDSICRWYAIRALGDLNAVEYGELLINVLEEPDISVGKSSLHRIAAHSIGKIGNVMVLPLVKRLPEARLETQIGIVDALGEIGDESAIPFLIETLTSSKRELVLWTSLSLAKIGESALDAIDNILLSLSGEEIFFVLDAIVMIGTTRTLKSVAIIAKKFPSIVHDYFTCGTRLVRADFYLSFIHDLILGNTEDKKYAELISAAIYSDSNKN